jgi:tRNA threonylcarbamoyladenosine dehydratase
LNLINDRFSSDTAEKFLNTAYDYIVDAFDNGPGKALLASHCRQTKKKLIVLGSVGGKKDPSKIKIDDLSRSSEDSLLAFMRKKLRADYRFPRAKDKKFSIPCVFSTEKYVYPEDHTSKITKLDCGGGMGAITHLAGAFGFFATSRVINDLVKGEL